MVDLSAIAANWRAYAALAAPAECAAVVKADAYGMGADRVAPALAAAGARTFFTASLGEALEARHALGPGPRIFVLEGYHGAHDAFRAATLAPILNCAAQAAEWIAAGGGPAGVHVDTGMNRLGAATADLPAIAELLAGAPASLLMSHLACASSPAHPMNEAQRKAFLAAAAAFPGATLSLAASAGTALGRAFHFDLVRPGVGLYGDAGLDANELGGPRLAAAFRLEAPILQVRDIGPGETVGYGAIFVAERAMKVAAIAAGYADGVLRALSGRGYGVLAGRRCRLLGRVSMDLVTLDVTDAGADAAPGAMVELIGPDAPLSQAARLAETAPYELLTGMRGLPKIYEGADA